MSYDELKTRLAVELLEYDTNKWHHGDGTGMTYDEMAHAALKFLEREGVVKLNYLTSREKKNSESEGL